MAPHQFFAGEPVTNSGNKPLGFQGTVDAGIVGGGCLKASPSLSPDAGIVNRPILQMRKLRLREGKSCIPRPQSWSWDQIRRG